MGMIWLMPDDMAKTLNQQTNRFFFQNSIIFSIHFAQYLHSLSSKVKSSEKECIDGLFKDGKLTDAWETAGNSKGKFSSLCAPLVTIKMVLTENGTAIKSILLREENRLPYGPGLSTKLLTSQDVLNGIQAIFK